MGSIFEGGSAEEVLEVVDAYMRKLIRAEIGGKWLQVKVKIIMIVMPKDEDNWHLT
jgi:hypothetical protein